MHFRLAARHLRRELFYLSCPAVTMSPRLPLSVPCRHWPLAVASRYRGCTTVSDQGEVAAALVVVVCRRRGLPGRKVILRSAMRTTI